MSSICTNIFVEAMCCQNDAGEVTLGSAKMRARQIISSSAVMAAGPARWLEAAHRGGSPLY